MENSASKNLSRAEFGRIMENMEFRKKASEHAADKPYLPLEMGIFLTGRCNLRCRHCFVWNEDGFLTKEDDALARREIPIEIIEQCLEYTKPAKTRLYLWGGEPLAYLKLHELTKLLKDDPRWTTICTNGLLIDRHLDDLLEISDNLVLLISLDGNRKCNDAIRGDGTFDRVVSNIQMLKELQDKGRYRGEISVCSVISDDMIGGMYEFCEFMEGLGVNTLYLSFPWYISPETAEEMDAEFSRRFSDIAEIKDLKDASWHSFTFHIDPVKLPALKEEYSRIMSRDWKIRVRFQPAIEPDEIDDFVLGGSRAAQRRTRCLAPFNRMDILQNGDVTSCKLFKELCAGNINEMPIKDIWEGEKMAEIRERLGCGLMPACSKCVLLYLNGE